MKSRQISLIILLASFSLNLYAQGVKDAIYVKKVPFGTYKFIQNDVKMNLKEIIPVIKSNPEAYTLILKAQKTRNWYMGLGIVSSALIFTQIVFVKEPQPYLLGAFLLTVIPTYPLLLIYGDNAHDAANAYNLGLKNASAKANIHLGITPNGFGAILMF